MPTTRRTNGRLSSEPSSSPPTTRSKQKTMPTTTVPPPTHSPYLPTRTESLLLLIYPLTLLLGSLFSYLSPSLRPPWNASTYSHVHQSFQPPSAAPSYFAQKRNVFNVYFVKIGWFWCTLAFVAFAAFVAKERSSNAVAAPSTQSRRSGTTTVDVDADDEEEDAARFRRRWQAALRYLAATAFWIATTQWFLGPALVDRGFALTGGVCELATEKVAELERAAAANAGAGGGGGVEAAARRKEEVARLVSHAACRVAGGTWTGGYDISGHVFILVLGSGMLWLEMLPFLVPAVKGFGVGRVVRTAEGVVTRAVYGSGSESGRRLAGSSSSDGTGDVDLDFDVDAGARGKGREQWLLRDFATTLALGVVALCWWMLLMTAAYFHTWFEKLTGCLWAFFALWVVYFLPRGQPAVRSLFGMPGV